MTSVLIVEDEPVLRVTTRDALTVMGYNVHDVADGLLALKLLEGLRFDAVVTDLRLPGVDGLEVLDAARRQKPPPAIVLVTAFGTVEAAVEAMRRGAYDFLTKPFRIEQLEAVLEQACRERAAQLAADAVASDPAMVRPLTVAMADHERAELHRALRVTQGNRTEAARLLGISRKALWEKLKRLG